MNVFYKPSCTVEKLSSSLVRAQELASAIVDFVVRDLRTVNVVDSLHLMEVAEPRYAVSLLPYC